ncbi:MAG: polymer-forming cytoskeletal protein [Anaerovorax sp.]|nr:polymer-forming cytoskeletal protein [Anaerovorax sp.]
MAERPLNNFKSAVNDLMNGKIKTEDTPGTTYSSEVTKPLYSEHSSSSTFTKVVEDTIPKNGMSILSSDLVIEGNVKSKSDIRLNGYIKGDILCEGSLISTGTVDGNVRGIGVTLSGSTINGNVIAKGDLVLDNSSTIIGDVRSAALSVNGKIKGNVMVSGSVILQENAIVMGNITAKSIAVENGASIKGTMEIRSAAINDEDFNAKMPAPRSTSTQSSTTVAATSAATASATSATSKE